MRLLHVSLFSFFLFFAMHDDVSSLFFRVTKAPSIRQCYSCSSGIFPWNTRYLFGLIFTARAARCYAYRSIFFVPSNCKLLPDALPLLKRCVLNRALVNRGRHCKSSTVSLSACLQIVRPGDKQREHYSLFCFTNPIGKNLPNSSR